MTIQWRFLTVDWMDAQSDSDWVQFAYLPEPVKITTRGWLVKESSDYIVIAASFQHADDGFGEVIAIPRGCIVTLEELKNGRED